jgi:hypothetical protein
LFSVLHHGTHRRAWREPTCNPSSVHVTVKLGVMSLEEQKMALRDRGILHNTYAEALFRRVVVERAQREITLALTSFAEVGLPSGGTLEELAETAASLQLFPAPLEAAIQLRLRWKGETEGDRITVVSPRASVDEREPRGFYLRRDREGFWLRGYVASDDWRFAGSERIALAVG